ncbi:MAG TPA: dipeptidase [Acidimicrobiales bacterium]|nr:dipeptidase [Acidimicrobiales bacterium]
MELPDGRLTAYASANRDRIVATLVDWLRIPSISAHPDRAGDVETSAEFTAALMRGAGLENVAVIPTPGAPSVYGDWLHAGADAPTVLVYGHHDVQPVDPLDLWDTPPFEPHFRDGQLFARGAIDDKGQVLYELEAARGLLETEQHLPVNLKFLVEGEEEVGSPNFEALLRAERDRLACDLVVVSDTGMLAPDVPSTCVAMRGLVGFDVRVRTARGDLHSGVFGGAVPNAARLAAELAAALHDADGRVTLPGFYDAVRPLSDAEQASLDAVPFDPEAWMAQAGVRALDGEAGRSTLERIGSRPTAEIVGISGGYQGRGMKTIVPAEAGFKVAMRLVPDQQPDAVVAAFEAWVAARTPPGVEVIVSGEGAVAPALTPVGHPAVAALSRVLERVWGRPALYTREGGSGPEEALGRVLAAPVLFLGVGLPDDRIHAPNERMVMDQFWKGLVAAGELWHELAQPAGSAT